MPYTIDVLPDTSIAVVTYEGHIDFEKDIKAIVHYLAEHQSEIGTVIHHVRDLKVGFSETVLGMAAAFRQEPNAPQLNLHTLVVGLPGFLKAIAQWLQQPQYGAKQVRLFDDLDEALAYARSALSRPTH